MPRILQIIPVLRVLDIDHAKRFYLEKLGFESLFENSPGEESNPSYLGVQRDGARLDLSSFSGDGETGGALRINVDDVDQFFRRLTGLGVAVKTPPISQSWGVREMLVDDPSSNKLRFTQQLR